MKKMTIKTKIILSFCLLFLAMLLLQIIFNQFFSREYFLSENKQELQQLFQKIEASYSDDAETLYELTETEDSVNGFSIQIFSDNNLIYSSRNSLTQITGNQLPNVAPTGDGQDFDNFSYNPEAIVLSSDAIEGDTLILQGMFLYEGGMRYVVLTKPVESIDASIWVFTRSSIIISLFVLFMGISVVIALARGIAKPIRNIEIVSQQLSQLDFSYQANEHASTRELSSLAISINSMSTQLANSMNQLQSANLQLQSDIENQMRIDDMRRQLIANVSHEMKTPLALLQIYCENLKADVEGINRDEYYEVILEETERLDNIVKDMLTLSSMEHQCATLQKSVLDFSAIARDTLASMVPLFEDFDLQTYIQPNLHVYGDATRLAEAMRNYLTNALSHTPPQGVIEVSLYPRRDQVFFAVTNQGKTIDQADLQNIWDPFYKSDQARTRVSNANAGLGLSIVRTILQHHAGNCGVENTPNGVCFYFHLTTIS